MTPKVDTFQQDIAEEIKRKDAALTDLSSAPNITDNKNALPVKKSPVLMILISASVFCILGILGVFYFYFHDSLLPPSSQSQTINPNDVPKILADLTKVSPTLSAEIGRNVTHVEKREKGYIITINNYSAVFAYMTRNESAYIDELALLFASASSSTIASSTSQKITQVASSTQVVATSTLPTSTTTPRQATTTSLATATSTKSTATSTKKTVPVKTKVVATSTKKTLTTASSSKKTQTLATSTLIPDEALLELSTTTLTLPLLGTSTPEDTRFKDITIENQNMRVFTSGTKTVVYAFTGDKTILISETPEGILVLKNAILR